MEETSVDMVLLCKQGRGRHTAATVSTPLLRGASLALHILLGQTILSSSKHEISVMAGGSTSRRRGCCGSSVVSKSLISMKSWSPCQVKYIQHTSCFCVCHAFMSKQQLSTKMASLCCTLLVAKCLFHSFSSCVIKNILDTLNPFYT